MRAATRKNLITAAALAALALLAHQAGAASVVARVAAVVNGEAILSTEVEGEMDRINAVIRDSGQSLPDPGALYDSVLNRLIEERLQTQRVRSLGLTVEEGEVDEAARRFLAQRNMSLSRYLREFNVSEGAFRRGIRDDLLVNRAVLRDNAGEMRVGQQEVNQELRARLARPELREHLLEHARFAHGDGELAGRASALSGEEFASFAAEHSASDDGVSLGWLTEGEMPTQFAEALRGLRPGRVSQVMELDNGLHVIHLVASRPLVPGHSQGGMTRIKLFAGGEGTSEQQLRAAAESVRSGELGFEEAAESVGGESWLVEGRPEELPASVTGSLRMISGEIGGPFDHEGRLVVAMVVGRESEVVGDEELRRQASALAADVNYFQVRRKWIEFLRSIGTVEIVRADP